MIFYGLLTRYKIVCYCVFEEGDNVSIPVFNHDMRLKSD